MRGRRRGLRWACTPALVAASVAALLIGTPATSAPLANCAESQLIPNVAQLLVSQGAPGYTRLARGKEAIVRAYLRNPTTCTVRSTQEIKPVSATLNVSYSNGASDPDTAPPQLTSNDPLSGKLAAATLAYSTADPYFVVPASYLAPANAPFEGGGPPPKFDITFTFALTYTRTGSASPQVNVTGQTTVTATVDQRTNALRMLVVPMGDRSSGSVQWSSTAETTLDNVLINTGRTLPVPSGAVKELTSTLTTAGIRYRVSGDLLDAKALGLYKTSGSTTKFCANGANWNTSQVSSGPYAGKTLKTELQERLDNYNLYNSPPADLVLGVIDGAIAFKSTDSITGGCDDGRAATPDPVAKTPGEVAWVRVDTGSYPTPAPMELAHTLGIVDPAVRATFHGLEVQTDGAAPDKVYNVLQRKVVMTGTASGVTGTNDHSIMNYDTSTIPYTKDNTQSFSRDWNDALCDLGGFESNAVAPTTPAFASCTISTAVGTDAGVAAGVELDMFHIDGYVSGSNVTVNDANTAAGAGEFGEGAPDSPLVLKLCEGPCEGAVNFRNVPLARSSQAPIGESHLGGPTGSTPPDVFSALISLQSAVPTVAFTCAELRLDGVLKFSSCASDPAPDIESTTLNPGQVLADFTPTHNNGRSIAFDGDSLLYATFIGDDAESDNEKIYKFTTSGAVSGTPINVGVKLGALSSFKPDGHLYGGNYTGTGDVYHIEPANIVEGQAVKQTAFTFDDTAFCLAGATFIDGLERLTPNAAGEERVAISGDRCGTIYIKKVVDGSTESSFTVPSGEDNSGITTDGANGLWLALHSSPTALATRLVHSDMLGNIDQSIIIDNHFLEDLAYDAKTFAPKCAVWGNTADESPAHLIAYEVPCGGSSSGSDTVGVETTNTEFVTLFAVCGTQAQATDPNIEKFSLGTYVPNEDGETVTAFTDARFCANATIVAEASNGWTSTGLTDPQASADPDAPSQSPVVNITAPFSIAKFRIGDKIHYEGYATDAEDGASAALIASLTWKDNGTVISEGTGQTSFDRVVPANASLGLHEIKLEATDIDNHTSFTTVTIRIVPKVCSSSSGCP